MSDQSRSKRSPADFRFDRQCTDNRRAQVVGERQILELISLGAPLAGILNKLCMMLDVRIGDVVSIVSLADADESHFCSMTRSALQVGLDTFSCSAILASDRTFLGTLEIFGCDPRRPTLQECQLIDRVAYLASLALQRPEADADADFETPAVKTRGRLGGLLEKTPFIN
jgi:hypothetical protein